MGARFSDFSSGKIIPGNRHTRAASEMHFLTSLIIIFGLAIVFGLALIKVMGDLSRISVHAPPDMLAMQGGRSVAPEPEHANTAELYETSNPQ
jgi:hypothetical protein